MKLFSPDFYTPILKNLLQTLTIMVPILNLALYQRWLLKEICIFIETLEPEINKNLSGFEYAQLIGLQTILPNIQYFSMINDSLSILSLAYVMTSPLKPNSASPWNADIYYNHHSNCIIFFFPPHTPPFFNWIEFD